MKHIKTRRALIITYVLKRTLTIKEFDPVFLNRKIVIFDWKIL